MKIKLESIEMDKTIQCRDELDQDAVKDYAEKMEDGKEFDPIILFGRKNSKYWIGDGWHRIAAAGLIGFVDIPAEINTGGRLEAVRYALGANAEHGVRRTNADKRRCVKIALREFGNLSSRAVAEMCGVSHMTVERARPEALVKSDNATRTTTDGRQYPARRNGGKTDMGKETETKEPKRVLGPPCDGMQFARMAIMDLEQIREDDVQREEAYNTVKGWIETHES